MGGGGRRRQEEEKKATERREQIERNRSQSQETRDELRDRQSKQIRLFRFQGEMRKDGCRKE